MEWCYGEIGTAGGGESLSYFGSKKQDKMIKDKYTVLNIIASGSGMQYRVLSDTPPEEKHILQDPPLEDGYMYLLNQTDGGIEQ